MSNLIFVPFCLALGFALRFVPAFPREAFRSLNAFIIYVALPALTLHLIPRLTLVGNVWYPVLMGWLMFLLAAGFFVLVARVWNLNRSTLGALIMTAGFANTSFVGFPVLEAVYGVESLQIGILADQPGCFLALATVGVATATTLGAGKSLRPAALLRKVLAFPPFLAFVVALLLRALPPLPDFVDNMFVKLGSTLVPLALTSVGMQINPRMGGISGRLLALTLAFRLLIFPALMLLLFYGLLGARGLVMKVTVLEAAMGPMITAGIIAVENKLNPPLVNAALGIGIPLSLLTVAGWYWLLEYLTR